ncbi:MAG: peptide chain release factor N(5)-glutamine methyltransferase [Candidatus Korobacteraceae bacterium]
MQIRQTLHSAIAQLEAAAVEESRLQAEVLIFHVLHCDRAHLFAHPERELTSAEQSHYEQLVARRAAGEPLQYLTGHQEFWKADFLVTPAVLIPRPETEHLIEAVLDLVRQFSLGPLLKLIDVGTGSGAIAITLARELPQAEVHAVDLSPDALHIARLNAARLDARVQFAQSDVLASTVRDATFDFVVSNPPYVGHDEADKVQEVVKHYEPPMAVFAGDDGLDVIRRLIPQAREALRTGGWLLIEIGYTQSQAVRALLGGWHSVHIIADLAGIPRVIAARKPA